MTSIYSKVRNRALTFLARRGSKIEDICARREILCPPEDQQTAPGISVPGDFDRITAAEPTTTSIAYERTRMAGGPRHHGATILYELKDATLWDGWVSSKGWRSWNAVRPSPATGKRPVKIENAVFASTFVGTLYFAHWLTDDLPLLLEAARHQLPVITAARTPYSHEPGYLEMTDLHPQPLHRAHFRSLLWIDDIAQNSYRAAQYRELRRRISLKTSPVEGRKVILHRGATGTHRLLVNEIQIEEMLAKRGFEIVDPAKSTPLEIAQACTGARIALGVEGSQLAHAFFTMAPKGAIVAMIPPYRYINHYKDHTDCIGTMRYGSITGTTAPGGFSIDPEQLLHLLDLVETALNTPA